MMLLSAEKGVMQLSESQGVCGSQSNEHYDPAKWPFAAAGFVEIGLAGPNTGAK